MFGGSTTTIKCTNRGCSCISL